MRHRPRLEKAILDARRGDAFIQRGPDRTTGIQPSRFFDDVVVDGAQNIRINVITHGGVDQNLVAVTKRIERVEQACLVQETHFRAQLDAVQRSPSFSSI